VTGGKVLIIFNNCSKPNCCSASFQLTASSNENTKQIVNSSKKKSNATKNEIAKIAKNISPNNAQNKESAGAEKEDYLANNQANTPSKIPTETPKTVNPDFIKTSPILIPKIPADVPNDKLNELSLLPTLEADFLDIPMTELEDSLDIDPQIQKVLKPKKLRLGWSAEIVVGEKNYGDYVAIALISFRTGLTADYKLNRKLDLHFDLLGRREAESIVTRVNEGEAQGGKAYGFGVTEITNLYRFKTQYFVESAALLRYKINQRHAIGVGIGAKYLFSVRADILQRSKDAQFNFDNYEVSFIERDEVINSGWWEKESTKDLLPFGQLRYDFRTTRHSTLFFKMNAEYNRTWLQRGDLPRRFRLETSLGFNYQF